MLSFIDVKFESNQFYLMVELLTNLEKISKVINGNNENPYLKRISKSDKEDLKSYFKEFYDLANEFSEIRELLDYDKNFRLLEGNREEQIKYNKWMNAQIESFANIDTLEDLDVSDNAKYAKAFEALLDTEFFKYVNKKAIEHANEITDEFDSVTTPISDEMESIIGNTKTDQITFITLPPEFLSKMPHYLPNSEIDGCYKGVVSFPPILRSMGKNLPDVILLHEITHTEIPLPDKNQFENEVQYDIYSRINHSLVELANDCEMGMQMCGFDNYFQTPMHNEMVLDEQGDVIDINDLSKYGVDTDFDFNFECETKDAYGRTTTTPKNSLSNAKIIGAIYPYFLMYKNRNSGIAIEETMEEILRDKEVIKEIYGEDFFESISNKDILKDIFESIKGIGSLQELNDIISEKLFDIEKSQEKTKEEGKMTIEEEMLKWGIEKKSSTPITDALRKADEEFLDQDYDLNIELTLTHFFTENPNCSTQEISIFVNDLITRIGEQFANDTEFKDTKTRIQEFNKRIYTIKNHNDVAFLTCRDDIGTQISGKLFELLQSEQYPSGKDYLPHKDKNLSISKEALEQRDYEIRAKYLEHIIDTYGMDIPESISANFQIICEQFFENPQDIMSLDIGRMNMQGAATITKILYNLGYRVNFDDLLKGGQISAEKVPLLMEKSKDLKNGQQYGKESLGAYEQPAFSQDVIKRLMEYQASIDGVEKYFRKETGMTEQKHYDDYGFEIE